MVGPRQADDVGVTASARGTAISVATSPNSHAVSGADRHPGADALAVAVQLPASALLRLRGAGWSGKASVFGNSTSRCSPSRRKPGKARPVIVAGGSARSAAASSPSAPSCKASRRRAEISISSASVQAAVSGAASRGRRWRADSVGAGGARTAGVKIEAPRGGDDRGARRGARRLGTWMQRLAANRRSPAPRLGEIEVLQRRQQGAGSAGANQRPRGRRAPARSASARPRNRRGACWMSGEWRERHRAEEYGHLQEQELRAVGSDRV